MLNVKFHRKQKTLNESLQASGQSLLLEGLVDDVLKPLLKKYEDSAIDLKMLQGLGEWPEITPGPKKPNVKGLSGPEKAEAFREFNRLRDETKEKNKPKQEEIDRKVKLIKWANLMYGEGPKDHPPREALPVVHEFLNKLQTMRDKYKSNEDFKKKVGELSSGTSNDPLDINQFTSDDMREIIGAIEVQAGEIQGDPEQAQKDKIGETENWEVFMPTTMPSSCKLGKGTTWCTARTRGDNLFYNYVAKLDSDIVLFYVIKKNAGTPPKEHPKDYLSLGYRENGKKIENYDYGGVNIDSDNEGVRPEEFASIVGEEESKEVYRIIKKRFKTFKEHPAKEKFREATQDLNAFNSLFTKGQSIKNRLDTIQGIRSFGKRKIAKEVKKAINDKMIEMMINNKKKLKEDKPIFRDVDFRGLDLRGLDLSHLRIWRPNFEGVNLQRANLKGTQIYADLGEANLKGVNLRGADLRSCDLINVSLAGADLRNSNLDLASVRGVDLQGVSLEGSKFGRVRFTNCRLEGFDFRRVNLQQPVFSSCRLQRANFEGANLNDAQISSCKLQKANLKNANLQGAGLRYSVFNNADLQGANLEGTNLNDADLQGANLQGADLFNADLQGANLNNARLKRTSFVMANLEGTSLEGTNLKGAELRSAKYNSQTKFPKQFFRKFNPKKHRMDSKDTKQNSQENQGQQQQQQQQELREFKEFLKDRRII